MLFKNHVECCLLSSYTIEMEPSQGVYSHKNGKMAASNDKKQTLELIMSWVSDQLHSNHVVPRVDDVVKYAYQTFGFKHLKRSDIAKRLRLHPAYLMNSSQKRQTKRHKRHRPIVANTLGVLHGDIGFYAVTRDYETPSTFRAGFLILKDVLSRYLYVAILKKTRKATSIIQALQSILDHHTATFGPNGHKIKSISFDRETSVMSHQVQQFLKDNHIGFHAFRYSASKSKMAENAIRLIRTDMKRLLIQHPNRRWWNMLETVVDNLNSKPITLNKKILNWRPKDVNKQNVNDFIKDLQKADPAHFFSQFEIAPRLVQFMYPVGSIVRPKLIVTSSAVIGEKRSEVNLESDSFVVQEHIPYVNARLEIGRAYRCFNTRTREEEIFDEYDLAESI